MTIAAWDAILDEPVADQAWLDTVALLALDLTTGPAAEGELKRFRTQLADAAVKNWPDGSSASVREQLRLLVVQLDAAIGRRKALRHLEPTGSNAKVIDCLRTLGGSAFNEALQKATSLRSSHLSRACNQLEEAGMLFRRKIGRQVEWTLTPLVNTVKIAPQERTPTDSGKKRADLKRLFERQAATAAQERKAAGEIVVEVDVSNNRKVTFVGTGGVEVGRRAADRKVNR